jgi:streptogramin lyase
MLLAALIAAASLVAPYDIELDARGRLHVADGGKHQILRWEAKTKRFTVVARSPEPTSLAFDKAGNLYWSDVHDGVVRRLAPSGEVSDFAQVPAAVGVSVDPTGKYLAVASIEQAPQRFDLATGVAEPLAGPPTAHALAYDAAGALWIADPGSGLYRLTTTLEKVGTIRVGHLAATSRGLYVMGGSPSGGRVWKLDPATGRTTLVAGTGRLGRNVNGVRATKAPMLPSDVAVLGSGLLVAQVQPVASIRRIDKHGVITTYIR